jgi:hypothetical protein
VTCEKLAITTAYASTNTKKKLTNVKAVLDDEYQQGKTIHTITPSNTNSAAVSVTGERFMFWGVDDGTSTLNSDYIRNYKNGSTASKATEQTVDATGKYRIWIALPAGRSLNNLYSSLGSSLGSVMKYVDSSTKTDVKGANGYTASEYTLYIYTSNTSLNGIYTINIG